jgi:hypothetical protein
LCEVNLVAGDSLDSLAAIAARHGRIDFALLDSAPSATHTLREFLLLEPRFGPGSRLLVDDAALPGARLLLSPCRKGKLIVPYLLASPFWTVTAHPRAGDSMVSAVLDAIGARADSGYGPGYVDRWRSTFDGACGPCLRRSNGPSRRSRADQGSRVGQIRGASVNLGSSRSTGSVPPARDGTGRPACTFHRPRTAGFGHAVWRCITHGRAELRAVPRTRVRVLEAVCDPVEVHHATLA